MSALAQRTILSQQRLAPSELEAIFEISRRASLAIELNQALDSVAEVALWVEGVRMIRVEAGEELALAAGDRLVWGTPARTREYGCAIWEINAAGWKWGNLRLHFDLRNCSLENPLNFCRFVAEQMAGVLNRLALLGQREMINQQSGRLAARLARRKAVERAKGILSEMHNIPESESLKLLIEISRGSRRDLRHVAQTVISARV